MTPLTSTKPMPATSAPATYARYPFKKMEVGQSFEFDSLRYRTVQSAASMYGKRNGKKFIFKPNGDGTCTCWRSE